MTNTIPKAGELIHRVQIQADAGTTTDALGEPVEDWQTVAYRYASIEPLGGRELWTAQQVQADVSHRIRMRFYAGVTPKMRILFQSRIFNIGVVRNLEERCDTLELLCKEAV